MGSTEEPFVRSLERGLHVLRCFRGDPDGLTLTEVAHRAAMSPAAARRYLHTLERLGYLTTRDRRFHPLPRLVELAYPYFAASGLTRTTEAAITTLATRLRASCALTVLDGHDALNVFCANEPEGLSIQLKVGRRLPTYCTAMGRAILSGHSEEALRAHFETTTLTPHTPHTLTTIPALLNAMKKVHTHGYAIGDQEYELGVRTIAMPLHDRTGKVTSAISVSTPASAVPLTRLTGEIHQELRNTINAITPTP